jgi:hypothetical protein
MKGDGIRLILITTGNERWRVIAKNAIKIMLLNQKYFHEFKLHMQSLLLR